jgi:hypothetical protein
MRNRLFLALIVCFSVFALGAHASDSAINTLPPAPEVLSKQIVTTSDDVSVDITRKNVPHPTISASTIAPFYSNPQSVGNTGSTRSMMA